MRFFSLIALASVSLVAASPALAFTLNSTTNPNLQGWENPDIQLMLNPANCPAGVDVAGLIADAAEAWNGVPTSSVKVSYGGTTASTTFSSPPTVVCVQNFQAVVGADQDYVPGAAAVSAPSGRITGGLMYLNASSGLGNIANFDRDVLTIIMAHEIGHILGLGHSESTSALMYYDASPKEHLRLSQDDIDGISYLYPADELGGDKIAGCGLIESLPPPGPGAGRGLFLLALLPIAAWAWSRRRTNSVAA